MSNGNEAAWKRAGDQLRRRRIELGGGDRQKFVAAHGLKYRIINDLENGNRGNYEPDTLIAAEVAYQLGAGSLRRSLDGGELEFLPPPGPAAAPGPGAFDETRGVRLDDRRTLELLDVLTEPTRAALEHQIGEALRKDPAAAGPDIFPAEPFLAAVWDLATFGIGEKVDAMVVIRNRAALRRLQDDQDRRAG